jgi:hypothetical protein
LHPSGRFSSPSGRLLVFNKASDSFQVQIREYCCNRLDYVDYCSDTLIYKERFAIQIQQSGHLSAWSGCAFNRYGNCVFNFNRPDACLSWSGRAKPYMDITCSGRSTVRTTLPHRRDAALVQKRFSVKISEILVAQLSVRTAHVHCPDGTRIFHRSRPFEPQPINRGPWALRTARIRY